MTMIIKGLSKDAFTTINETFGGAKWYIAKVFCDYDDMENDMENCGLDVSVDLESVTIKRIDDESVSLYRSGWTALLYAYDFVKIEII